MSTEKGPCENRNLVGRVMHHQLSESKGLMVGDLANDKGQHQQRMLGPSDEFDKSSSKARDKNNNNNKALVAVVDGNQINGTTEVGKGEADMIMSDGSWFKAAQLATELLLMLFVSGLLLMAAVVIFSKKSPEFMESYEILPKTLFILCIVVAILSFLHWLYTKTLRLIKRNCCHQEPSAIYNLVTTQPEIVLMPRIGMTTTGLATTRIESSKSKGTRKALGVYIEQEREPLNPVGASVINEE